MEKVTYKAEEIAQWFINRCYNDPENGEFISNLKLQKLLYYAQGASLALRGKRLFNDRIIAWEHGPVVYEVWNKYRGQMAIEDVNDVNIDDETDSLLETVYKVFGQFSAWKLRDMTHKEDPWEQTAQNKEIKIDLIKKYFEEHYVK